MMRIVFVLLVGAIVGLAPDRLTASAQSAKSGVDLGIGRGTDSHRPNILVAWRNTERILEVEILVRNLGDRPGRGTVRLEICDDEGNSLLTTEPFPVAVPARDAGGEHGTIVQTKGFSLMNLMFDELDRLNQRYKLRAIVETTGEDMNLVDNVITKSFNVDGRALPNTTTTYRYRLANTTTMPLTGTIHFDHTPIPNGWTMTGEPSPGSAVSLAAGEVFTGYVTVKTPAKIADGQRIDLQAGIVSTANGVRRLIDSDEWFLVATTQPPQVDTPQIAVRPDGTVAVNVAAFDPICGIKEASGVQVAYSLDHGTTFSSRVLAYARGNFYDKTWFEGVIGPFVNGVEIDAVLTVANNAGIVRRFNLPPVKVGQTTATQSRQQQ